MLGMALTMRALDRRTRHVQQGTEHACTASAGTKVLIRQLRLEISGSVSTVNTTGAVGGGGVVGAFKHWIETNTQRSCTNILRAMYEINGKG